MQTNSKLFESLTQKGWAIFPLATDSKRPAVKEWETLASVDAGTVNAWYDFEYPGCNFGVCPGRAGLVVIDCDTHAGKDGEQELRRLCAGEIPATYTVRTPSGGKHYYYQAEGVKSRNNVAPGVDIKSNGGYVVAPGSVLSAGEYIVIDDRAPVALPECLKDLMHPAVKQEAPVEAGQAGSAIDFTRALNQVLTMPVIAHGGRDNQLFKLCALWKNIGLQPATMLSLIHTAESLGKIEQPAGDELTETDFRRIIASAWKKSDVPFGTESVDAQFPDDLGEEKTPEQKKEERRAQARRWFNRRNYSAQDLLARDLPEVKWIIPRLIPTGLTVLAGPAKVGKSFLILQMCEALTRGEANTFLGRTVSGTRNVLYFALEDTPRRLKDRCCQLFGKGADNNERLRFMNEFPLLDAVGRETLEEVIEDCRADVVIIDVWQKVRQQSDGRRNMYQSEYEELATLKSIADRKECAIVLIHHFKKYKKGDIDDALQKLNGSSAIAGAADSLCLLERPGRGDTGELSFICREADDTTISLVHQENGGWAYSEENDNPDFQAIIPETDNQRLVLDILRKPENENGVQIQDIVTQAEGKIDLAYLRQLISRWLNRGQLLRLGRGKYCLPKRTISFPDL